MSRCFPYHPPGYVRNGIRDEAVIKSVKLQREEEKAKKEKKKEKKREKREKEKTRGIGEIENKKHSQKKRRKDERSKEDQKGGDLQKRAEKETEQLEKSSLTEECGQPVGSQNSSDSTLNSNKRQKLSSPSDGRHNSGSIIRIRLPLQRHKDPEVLPSKEQPCLAPRRTDDASVQVMHEPAPPIPGREGVENPCSTSRKICPEFTIRLSKEKPCLGPGRLDDASIQQMHEPALRPGGEGVENPCSTSRKMCPELAVRLSREKHRHSIAASESSAKKPCLSTGDFECCFQMAETSPPSKLCGSCSPRLGSKFRDVVENWVPPAMLGLSPLASFNRIPERFMADCNRGQDFYSSQDHEKQAASTEKKYGGLMPKKKPLISKDNRRAFFDSADWALYKQGAGVNQNATVAIETLRPKLQRTPHQQLPPRRPAYTSGEDFYHD